VSPQFPPELSTRAKIAITAVALLTFLYSIVIAGQILLWFIVAGFAVGLYLIYLLIVAVFRLVAAVERIATAAEVDSGIRTVADARASGRESDGDEPAVSPASDGAASAARREEHAVDASAAEPDPNEGDFDESDPDVADSDGGDSDGGDSDGADSSEPDSDEGDSDTGTTDAGDTPIDDSDDRTDRD